MTKYKHGGDGEVGHTPLVHEDDLTMGREERSASSREEVGWARAEEVGDWHDRNDHLDEGIAKLEQGRDEGRQGGETA